MVASLGKYGDAGRTGIKRAWTGAVLLAVLLAGWFSLAQPAEAQAATLYAAYDGQGGAISRDVAVCGDVNLYVNAPAINELAWIFWYQEDENGERLTIKTSRGDVLTGVAFNGSNNAMVNISNTSDIRCLVGTYTYWVEFRYLDSDTETFTSNQLNLHFGFNRNVPDASTYGDIVNLPLTTTISNIFAPVIPDVFANSYHDTGPYYIEWQKLNDNFEWEYIENTLGPKSKKLSAEVRRENGVAVTSRGVYRYLIKWNGNHNLAHPNLARRVVYTPDKVHVINWGDPIPLEPARAEDIGIRLPDTVLTEDGGLFTTERPQIVGVTQTDRSDAGEVDVTVTWEQIEYATGYELVYTLDNGAETTVDVEGSTDVENTITIAIDEDQEKTMAAKVRGVFVNAFGASATRLEAPDGLTPDVVIQRGVRAVTPYGDDYFHPVGTRKFGAYIDSESAADEVFTTVSDPQSGVAEITREGMAIIGLPEGQFGTVSMMLCLLISLAVGGGALAMLGTSGMGIVTATGFFTMVWVGGGYVLFGLPLATVLIFPALIGVAGILILKKQGVAG